MAVIAKEQREFDSYFLEYQLLNSEQEINAFWTRMERVLEKMTEKEKSTFFKQLEGSIENSFELTDELINQLELSE
jgi:molecular chaperone GrpE (heat shock protein)